jgi:hypothetical protein
MKEEFMVEELSYQNYQMQQLYEVSNEGMHQRAKSVKKGNKFRLSDSGWEPIKYEGFAILSMVNDNPLNSILAARLKEIQIELAKEFNAKNLYFLPPESFHQTIANLLSEERFRDNVLNKGYEPDFPGVITSAFESIGDSKYTQNIDMKIVGLAIFGSAIGVLGIFNNQVDYERIINFRQEIYTNGTLNQYGITRTRPFIGHITMAYIESNLSEEEKEHLIDICYRINQSLETENLHFYIEKTSLNSYKDLSCFHSGSDFPSLKI